MGVELAVRPDEVSSLGDTTVGSVRSVFQKDRKPGEAAVLEDVESLVLGDKLSEPSCGGEAFVVVAMLLLGVFLSCLHYQLRGDALEVGLA